MAGLLVPVNAHWRDSAGEGIGEGANARKEGRWMGQWSSEIAEDWGMWLHTTDVAPITITLCRHRKEYREISLVYKVRVLP